MFGLDSQGKVLNEELKEGKILEIVENSEKMKRTSKYRKSRRTVHVVSGDCG